MCNVLERKPSLMSIAEEALRSAVASNDLKLTKMMLCEVASVNGANKYGVTALHIAVANKFKKITLLLLRNGADCTMEDNFGFTPIHFAIMCKDLTLAKTMLAVADTKTSANVLQFCKERFNCVYTSFKVVKHTSNKNYFQKSSLQEFARHNLYKVLHLKRNFSLINIKFYCI